MIIPSMNFIKNVKLSITDLGKAKVVAEEINRAILAQQVKMLTENDLTFSHGEGSNGTYEYNFQNNSLRGDAKLVVGWDMQLTDGESKRFMALNFNHKFGHCQFLDSIEGIEKIPDKAYFTGMLIGAFFCFVGCMGYAYYTEALDVFFFFIVILVGGWLSSKVGAVIGERIYNKKYDSVSKQAMLDTLYVESAENIVQFNDAVGDILDKVLEEDQLMIVS